MIHADEALELSLDVAQSAPVKTCLAVLQTRITTAAKRGERSVEDIWAMIPPSFVGGKFTFNSLSNEQKECVRRELREHGYSLSVKTTTDVRGEPESSVEIVTW